MVCQTVTCLTMGETGKQTRRFRALSRVRAGDQTDWPVALVCTSEELCHLDGYDCCVPSCKARDCQL